MIHHRSYPLSITYTSAFTMENPSRHCEVLVSGAVHCWAGHSWDAGVGWVHDGTGIFPGFDHQLCVCFVLVVVFIWPLILVCSVFLLVRDMLVFLYIFLWLVLTCRLGCHLFLWSLNRSWATLPSNRRSLRRSRELDLCLLVAIVCYLFACPP